MSTYLMSLAPRAGDVGLADSTTGSSQSRASRIESAIHVNGELDDAADDRQPGEHDEREEHHAGSRAA